MAVDNISRVRPAPGPAEARPGTTAAGRLRSLFDGAYRILTERPLSLYAAAFMRIGYGLLYLVLLVREFPNRHEIWGPGSPWTPALAHLDFEQSKSGWFTPLTLSENPRYFEACYAVAVLVAFLFLIGWRTRVVSVLFAIVMASFYSRNLMMGDGGDNLAMLMAVYLPFTACGRRWSLDARRARKPVPDRFPVTVVHNCAMLVIMAQMCILYGAASLYKVQGQLWVDGTALHYVLQSELFRPWPALSDFADSHSLVIGLTTYLTVLAQIAFPFSLFSRLKYVVLAILVGMHLGIAVLLGLPLFSGVMILGDAAFLPDRFYQSLARVVRRRLRIA